MSKHYSIIAKKTTGIIYPYILVFGLYIIFNGHKTPGGGFQGGAILSSIFIINYIVSPEIKINLKILTISEKVLYFFMVVLAIIFVLYYNDVLPIVSKQIYMIAMNLLIGFEVFCGLSVIFFRFIYFESR